MQPELIVLDEPTSFLDPLSAERIFEIIHEMNKKLGITVVLVEHRLDLTAKFANRIIIMDKGRICLDGKPRDILTNKKTRLLGVGIPKATLLYQELLEDKPGIKNNIPLCSEELANHLQEVLKSK